jgi:flagellar motor switch protein FliG
MDNRPTQDEIDDMLSTNDTGDDMYESDDDGINPDGTFNQDKINELFQQSGYDPNEQSEDDTDIDPDNSPKPLADDEIDALLSNGESLLDASEALLQSLSGEPESEEEPEIESESADSMQSAPKSLSDGEIDALLMGAADIIDESETIEISFTDEDIPEFISHFHPLAEMSVKNIGLFNSNGEVTLSKAAGKIHPASDKQITLPKQYVQLRLDFDGAVSGEHLVLVSHKEFLPLGASYYGTDVESFKFMEEEFQSALSEFSNDITNGMKSEFAAVLQNSYELQKGDIYVSAPGSTLNLTQNQELLQIKYRVTLSNGVAVIINHFFDTHLAGLLLKYFTGELPQEKSVSQTAAPVSPVITEENSQLPAKELTLDDIRGLPLPLTVSFKSISKDQTTLPVMEPALFDNRDGSLLLLGEKIADVNCTGNGDSLSVAVNEMHQHYTSIEDLTDSDEMLFTIDMELDRIKIPLADLVQFKKGSRVMLSPEADVIPDAVIRQCNYRVGEGDCITDGDYYGLRFTKISVDQMPWSTSNDSLAGRDYLWARVVLGSTQKKMSQILTFKEGSEIFLQRTMDEYATLVLENGIVIPCDLECINGKFEVILTGNPSLQGTIPLVSQEEGRLTSGMAHIESLVIEKNNSSAQNVSTTADLNSLIQQINSINPRTLYDAVADNENPQVIALVLSVLETDRAAVVLSAFDKAAATDIAKRIAVLYPVKDRDKAVVLSQIVERCGEVEKSSENQSGGIDQVIDLLNRMDKKLSANIIDKMGEVDPELAEFIKDNRFNFEDIVLLDDAAVQQVLRTVDTYDLAMALKNLEESDVMDKITGNMSQRASSQLLEDMKVIGPVRLVDIEKAQNRITKNILQLEEDGEIIIVRGSPEEPEL